MKKFLLLVAAALVAYGGYRYWNFREAEARAAEATAKAAPTAKAERGDLRIVVSASGRVEPEREVEIKSKASGEVIKVFADISDQVKQGEMLFKLDPVNEERTVARLRATLAMSRAKLEQVKLGVAAAEAKLEADKARADADLKYAEAERQEYSNRLNRARQLFDQKVISREEYDTAVTRGVQTESALANARLKIDDLKVQALELDRTRQEIAIAEAQVDNDEVALADAEQRLKETEVFSPIDGVVSDRTIQEGIIVASGVSNVGGGTTAMKLIDLSRIYAIAAVDEADIKGVVPGVKAVITADAFKGTEFSGTVVRVAAKGVVDSNVVTFDIKVEVDGRRKQLLKPEMTTNVQFLVDERKNAILVPAAAVVRKAAGAEADGGGEAGGRTPAGGRPGGQVDYSRRQSYVTVVKPGGAEEERRVETGITDGYKIEIVSGLSEGEEVLLLQQEGDTRWAGQAGARRGPPPRM